MRFIKRGLKSALVFFLLVAVLQLPGFYGDPNTRADSSCRLMSAGNVDVLIYFDTADYYWANVTLAQNCTAINVTEAACKNLGFNINISWNKTNATVLSINGIVNATDWSMFWQLWIWNENTMSWSRSLLNCSQLILNGNNSIAWSYGPIDGLEPEPNPIIRRPVAVEVLFDFGNGSFSWAQTVSDLEKLDGLNVTMRAADLLDFEVISTISEYGAFIESIGGLKNAVDWCKYWMLWLWNDTVKAWETSPVGISSLALDDGAVIAWTYSAFGEAGPGPTPLLKHPIQVEVLIDFGDGTFYWDTGFGLREPNNGLNITINALARVDLELNYTISEYGAFIESIGGLRNAADWSKYWALWLWNTTSGTWETSPVGISSLSVDDGDAIAWKYQASLDPAPYPTIKNRKPLVVKVLFYYGDGRVHVSEGVGSTSLNDGLNLSMDAAARIGIDFNFSMGAYGAFIDSIDGLTNDAAKGYYWLLYQWNATGLIWELSSVGASQLYLEMGNTIAWIYGSYADPLPQITPKVPQLDTAPPVLYEANVTYLGNSSYLFNVTVDYNGSGLEVFVVINETSYQLTPKTRSMKFYSTQVENITQNFTYYYKTNIRMSTESDIPVLGNHSTRNHYQDAFSDKAVVIEVRKLGPFISKDLKPIKDAEVMLTSTTGQVFNNITSSDGYAVFGNPIAAGEYSCVVKYNDTVIISIDNLSVSANGTVTYDAAVAPKSSSLDLAMIMGEIDNDDDNDDSDDNDDEDNNIFMILGLVVLILLSIILVAGYFQVKKKVKDEQKEDVEDVDEKVDEHEGAEE